MNLSNNTVLITGGGSGIGLAFAKRFLAAGSKVIICGRREGILREVCRANDGIEFLTCDLEQTSSRIDLFEDAQKRYPSLNVLVNNAGVQQHPPHLTQPQDWAAHAQELEINIAAPLHLSMLFLPLLLKQSSSAIINITSGLAFVPLAYVPTYSATKAALHSFTQSLRFQLMNSTVEVYEVAPPAVNTDLGGPGKHTFGVPVDDFADHAMKQLASGLLESGYQMSDQARMADGEQRLNMFLKMNEGMRQHFPQCQRPVWAEVSAPTTTKAN